MISLKKLHEYSPKLFFEIGGYPDGKRDLIITADGNLDYFPQVEEFVGRAPKLKDWNIIAFKPPADGNFVVEYNRVKIEPSKTWFLPLGNDSDPNMLGLEYAPPNTSPQRRSNFINAAYLALDSILGEESTALNVQMWKWKIYRIIQKMKVY